jgi:hypothetical protein
MFADANWQPTWQVCVFHYKLVDWCLPKKVMLGRDTVIFQLKAC